MLKTYLKYQFFLILISGLTLNVFAQNVPLADASDVITPSTALEHYIGFEDEAFAWEVRDSGDLGEVTVYQLLSTSQ